MGALGEALHHTDQPDAAVTAPERALRLSPLDSFRAEWMYRLAVARRLRGDFPRFSAARARLVDGLAELGMK